MSLFDRVLTAAVFLSGLGESLYFIQEDGFAQYQILTSIFLLLGFLVIWGALNKGSITVSGESSVIGEGSASINATYSKADDPRRFYANVGVSVLIFIAFMGMAFFIHIYNQQTVHQTIQQAAHKHPKVIPVTN